MTTLTGSFPETGGRTAQGQGPAGFPAFRGREPEGEQVRNLLARAQRGTGGVLVVRGGLGSGKSPLLRAAVEEAAELGFSLAVGAADQLGTGIPFFALRTALGQASMTAAADRDHTSLPDTTTLIRRIQAHLERRAASAPVLVCLDDLHWADQATLAALRILSQDLRPRPVAWLLAWSTTPPGGDTPLPGILAQSGAIQVTLGPLDQDAVTNVLTEAFGAPPGKALRDLASGAGGNASLTGELISGLRDDNVVRIAGGEAQLVSDRLPERIHRLAKRWLDGLSEQAKHLLMTAAVLDQEFRLEDVGEMLGKTPAMLLPAAGEAMRATLVTATDDAFAFRHELLRRAIGEMVPEPAARVMHRQYGELLLGRSGPGDRAVGHLLRAADSADRASLAGLDKAFERTRRSAPRTAADLAVRALELTPPADPDALPRAVAAAEALAAAGQLGRAAQIARKVLTRPLPAAAEARMRCTLSLALSAGGLVRDAADQAQLALALPRLPDHLVDQALNARLQAFTGVDDDLLGPVADTVMAAAGRHARHTIAAATVARAVVRWRGGRLGEALELLPDASHVATGISSDSRHVQPLLIRAAALINVRELSEAEEILRAADGCALRHTPAGAALSLLHARVHLAAGRLDGAAACGETALAAASDIDAHAYAAVAHCVLSEVALRRGDITAAAEHLARRPVGGPQFADIYAPAESIAAEARVTEARDGASAVLGQLRQLCAGIESRSGLLAGDPALGAWLARAALAAGDGQLAARVAGATRGLTDAHPEFPALAAAAAHAEGLALRDPELLAAAVAGHPDPWAKASAAEDLGTLRGRQGDADHAIRDLKKALCAYGEAGADRDRARVRGRLRELGIRDRHWNACPARPLTGWESLTETEQAVARLVAEGLNNKEVGGRMFISVHTVAYHLRQIYRKLCIGSRVELTRIVIEQAQCSS